MNTLKDESNISFVAENNLQICSEYIVKISDMTVANVTHKPKTTFF
jgi:hypothetical protein